MHIEHVLIIEDDKDAAIFVEEALYELSYKADSVGGLTDGRKALAQGHHDLVLLDIHLPDGEGIELLREAQGAASSPAFIVMSGSATIETAIEAMRLGAVDYLLKPFNLSQLEIAVRRAESWGRLRAENAYLRGEVNVGTEMVGSSPSMQKLRNLIQQVGPTQATVLIHGESGTGKELVARAIREASPRKHQSYIRLNCAAIPENLIESELFGHEKGAFTGASGKRYGRFEMADGGTLLLDEISEIPISLQSKLLRVLQEREFERLGGNRTVKVDVRVLATTNRNLREEVRAGRFREDLYFRLNVVPVLVPPLREREGDVDLLVDFFLRVFSEKYVKPGPMLSPGTRETLRKSVWPGNVRELQNCIERAVILTDSSRQFALTDFGLAERIGDEGIVPPEAEEDLSLDQLERRYVEKALKRTRGHVTRAAGLLGISVRALHYKLAKTRQDGNGGPQIMPDTDQSGKSAPVTRPE
jgi:DNA-binding NtrC family response regulator